ncbi:MAG: hypothetical protein AAF541_06750 [Pseudomonadota bacterium]
MIKSAFKYLAFAVGITGALFGCAYCSALLTTYFSVQLALKLNTTCEGLCNAQPESSFA